MIITHYATLKMMIYKSKYCHLETATIYLQEEFLEIENKHKIYILQSVS